METTLRDVRHGWRALRKRPGLTLAAVVSLALGVGANTAIYSVARAVFLRPLAVRDPATLVAVADKVLSYPAYTELRDENHVCAGLAAYASRQMNLEHDGAQPARVSSYVVTGNYFGVLGVGASVGRTLLPEDDEATSAPQVAVLSDHLWREQFGGDRGAVGKTVRLNGVPFTVVGVAPAEFRGTMLAASPDVYVPVANWSRLATGFYATLDISRRGWSWLSVVGRLRPGVAVGRAETELNQLARQNREANGQRTPPDFHYDVRPLAVAATGLESRAEIVRFMSLLAAVVAVALLIACANVANLLLARAASRRREIGVRLALGASRARLVRQLLTESVMMSLAGGALGLLVALWATSLLSAFSLPGYIALGRLDLGLKPDVLAFTFLLALATGVGFGLAPALSAAKADLVTALKDQGATGAPSRARVRGALVAAQVALCLLLLVCAGLFSRSLRNALNINLGFEPERVAAVSVNLGLQRYDEPRARAFYESLRERVAAQPGVESAAWASELPLGGGRDAEGLEIEGYTPASDDGSESLDVGAVSPGYFKTLGIELLAGRDFAAQDRDGAPGAVIVNEALARTYFGGQNPLGKRIKIPREKDAYTVVGVARDHKFVDLRTEPPPEVFFPVAQRMSDYGLTDIHLVARARGGDAESLLPALAREAHALDASVPLVNPRTLADCVRDQLAAQRFGSTLLALFSLLALALAVVGIYGVVAYSVAQRTREFGIRIALGARAGDILRLVLGRGSLPVFVGLAVGLAAAAASTRLLAAFFYGLAATDPATFAAAAALLAAVALAACYLPARRAAKVDPMIALRDE
ncbi:MAG: ABC transporter permease [Acidobacteria bacterium]|nr:ABC transporter permease [Acidobacteriota bacterium]